MNTNYSKRLHLCMLSCLLCTLLLLSLSEIKHNQSQEPTASSLITAAAPISTAITNTDENKKLPSQQKGLFHGTGNFHIFAHKIEDNLPEDKVSSKYRYFLSAVILVRTYGSESVDWMRKHLYDWVRYMQYSGVEHVYLYDHYITVEQALKDWCAEQFSTSELTYYDWSRFKPFTTTGTQLTAYKHALNIAKSTSQWQIRFNMDEYPFAPNNTDKGFLTHFILTSQRNNSFNNICEFSVKNFLFLGKRNNRSLVIEQYLRRTPSPANNLDKPIYRPVCVKSVGVNQNHLLSGWIRVTVSTLVLRMNHYWGARFQNWGATESGKVTRSTKLDNSSLVIADKMRRYEYL